jgi:hypothetical protein
MPGATDREAPRLDANIEVRRRDARISDVEDVARLKQKLGLRQDSRENWHRLWQDNPALSGRSPCCLGWVLEADGRIVGYLGNIPMRYHYGNKTLSSTVASGLAVEPAFRAHSLSLLAAFYRQENVDLFLNTTAIESVGRLVQAFKADSLPQPDYATVLFWALDVRRFVKAAAMKLGLNSGLGAMLAVAGALVLRGDIAISRRRPRCRAKKLQVDETNVESIDDSFQNLWLKKLKERPRLLADRSQAVLRWHFVLPGHQKTTRVLRCFSQGELVGYAIIRNETDVETGLRRAVVADLLALNNDPQLIEQLLAGAYECAKRSGVHTLEVLGFPREIRDICLHGAPYSRRYPACPFFYKAKDRSLHDALRQGDVWYACPYDGDGTLMP